MNKYKAIVLDLDGTLTNDAKEITPKTRDTLMQAQQAGLRIILASGRPTYGISALADKLEIGRHGGFVLAFNGGRIIEWGEHPRIIADTILDAGLVSPLHAAAKEAGCEILTYQGEGIAATSIRNKYVLHEAFINKMPVNLYDDFVGQVEHPINKCLIVGDPQRLIPLEQQLAARYAGRLSVYRSAAFFLECVPPGIDKAASLQHLIQRLGISREELMAVGDGYNDLSMIRFAGLGVAMANAAREVQDAADYITYSNQEDGVAHVVEKFFLRPLSQQ